MKSTKYILKHPTGSYQVNLPASVSIDEWKEKVKEGKDILTLFNLDDTYAKTESFEFFDECEISKEE